MGGALSSRKDFTREGLERWTEVHRLTDCIADGLIPGEFGTVCRYFFEILNLFADLLSGGFRKMTRSMTCGLSRNRDSDQILRKQAFELGDIKIVALLTC